MATIYQWKGAGYGVPHSRPAFQKVIDVPKLIAEGDKAGLATTSAPNTGAALPSTGFAAGDILEVFWAPKGFIVQELGMYVIVGEGATCTIDVGVTSATETASLTTNPDGYGAGFNLETAGNYDGMVDSDQWSIDTIPGGEIFITNGSIDIDWNHATDTTVFVIWADGILIDLTNPTNY